MNFIIPACFRFVVLFIIVSVIRSPQSSWYWGIAGLLFLAACIWQFVETVESMGK